MMMMMIERGPRERDRQREGERDKREMDIETIVLNRMNEIQLGLYPYIVRET